MELYGAALADANKAIELDKKYIKVCDPRFVQLEPELGLCSSGKWSTGPSAKRDMIP